MKEFRNSLTKFVSIILVAALIVVAIPAMADFIPATAGEGKSYAASDYICRYLAEDGTELGKLTAVPEELVTLPNGTKTIQFYPNGSFNLEWGLKFGCTSYKTGKGLQFSNMPSTDVYLDLNGARINLISGKQIAGQSYLDLYLTINSGARVIIKDSLGNGELNIGCQRMAVYGYLKLQSGRVLLAGESQGGASVIGTNNPRFEMCGGEFLFSGYGTKLEKNEETSNQIKLLGGKFNFEPTSSLIPEGYSVGNTGYSSSPYLVGKDWSTNNSLPAEAGYYRLQEDVTLNSTWNVPAGETHLDLNGHYIAQSSNSRVINLDGSDKALYVYDSNSSAEHSGYIDSADLWHLGTGEGETHAIKGGLITGGKIVDERKNGAGIYVVNGSSFIMNGGTIAGNSMTGNSWNYWGAGLYIQDGEFILNNGAVSYNLSEKFAGGLSVNGENATFIMNNGSINNNVGDYSGGMNLDGNCTAIFNGGSIKFNKAVSYQTQYDYFTGGVAVASPHVFFGGSIQVTDNVSYDKNGKERLSNVYLGYDNTNSITSTINIGTGSNNTRKPSDMEIGITGNRNNPNYCDVTAKNKASSGDEKYFFADDINDDIIYDSSNHQLLLRPYTIPSDLFYFKNTGNNNATIQHIDNSGDNGSYPLEISSNGRTWTSFDGSVGCTIVPQQKLYFRARNIGEGEPHAVFGDSDSLRDFYYFKLLGDTSLSVGGDVTKLYQGSVNDSCCGMFYSEHYTSALTDASDLDLSHVTMTTGAFRLMFSGCIKLVKAPALPATTLADSCYYKMFSGCDSLVNAPALPATTLADKCYAFMFSGCDSLVNAPDLPAMTLANACYANMFAGCIELVNAPKLPATTLKKECYDSMFYGCGKLVSAPTLSATQLADGCYQCMFMSCVGLTSAPELPATELSQMCYARMFEGCTNLVSAPILPATMLVSNCYVAMFKDCEKLNRVEVAFTDWCDSDGSLATSLDLGPSGVYPWLGGVSESGTFICSKDLPTTTRSASYIPVGWVIDNGSADPTASTGYYISFSGNKLTLRGTNLPDSFNIKPEESAADYQTVSVSNGFEYGCDLYEIKFTLSGKEYTMHANCKTVNAVTTVDTEILDLLLADVQDYNKDYPVGSTSSIVTSKTMVTNGPICNPDLHTSMFNKWGSISDEKDNYTDQMVVDQKTIELQTAISAFENSLDAQLVVLSGSSIVKGDSVAEYTGIRYSEGIVPVSKCAEKTFDDLKDLSTGFYTVIVDAKIYGFAVTKTYYVAVGSDVETNAAAKVAEALAEITPLPEKPSGGDDNPTVVLSVLDEGQQISAFVSIAPAENGKISIVPEPGVKVERIAISASEKDYMPLKKVDTSIDAIVNGTNYVKVLLRTGNDTKAFTTSVSVSCKTPAVAAYSGAVGVYSRGTNPDYIAYVKGDTYESLEDALAAELSGDTTVYYVKDGATLDKIGFLGTYTFFFGNSYKLVVTF